MTTIRKDISAVRVGDQFALRPKAVREVVSVRPYSFDVAGDTIPGREILHRSPHRPGVDYLRIPEGSQLAIFIP